MSALCCLGGCSAASPPPQLPPASSELAESDYDGHGIRVLFFSLAVDLVRSFFSVSPVISFRFSGNLVCRRALEKIAVLFRLNSAATVGNRLVDCQTTRQYCKRVSIVATVNTLGLPSRVSPVWWFRVCCILLISAGMLCRLQSPSRPARYSQPGAWIL